MDKKYQVFVSSTYMDLADERQKVVEALLSKNCFPVGMEYFPAANEDQFTVIKKLIDNCDYYILIIGGRYGSVEKSSGKSYTQLEYEYAVSRGIPVASFYHENPGQLPADKVEATDEGKKKLDEFKKIVQTKLCDHWKSDYELAFKVNKSLDYLFENSPRTGWIKADMASSDEANKMIYLLREDNERLKEQIRQMDESDPKDIDGLQQGEDRIEVGLHFHQSSFTSIHDWYDEKISVSWNEIISILCPLMIDECSEETLLLKFGKALGAIFIDLRPEYSQASHFSANETDFQTVKIQLVALQIIELSDKKSRSVKDTSTYWCLTRYGHRLMMKLKALRR